MKSSVHEPSGATLLGRGDSKTHSKRKELFNNQSHCPEMEQTFLGDNALPSLELSGKVWKLPWTQWNFTIVLFHTPCFTHEEILFVRCRVKWCSLQLLRILLPGYTNRACFTGAINTDSKCVVRHKANSWMGTAGSGPAETPLSSFACCTHTHKHTRTCAHTHTHNQLGNVKQLQIYFLRWTKTWSVAERFGRTGRACSFTPRAEGIWPRLTSRRRSVETKGLGRQALLLGQVTQQRNHKATQAVPALGGSPNPVATTEPWDVSSSENWCPSVNY